MKWLALILFFILFSCRNKEDILLPKSDVTVRSDVKNHSPIYIFFRTKGKDTLAEVNRKNAIILTNWIFNIDKRLPLRLVIPEVMKLKEKKRNEVAHKNELAENFYSYSDSIGKNMAFLPFTKVYYTIGEPERGGFAFVFYFKKGSDLVLINNIKIKKDDVSNYLSSFNFAVNPKILLVFENNLSFGEYLQTKILIRELDTFNKDVPEEFVY